MRIRPILGLTLIALAVGGGCDKTMAPGVVQADPLAPAFYPKIAALEGLQQYLVMATPPRVEPGPPMRVTCAIRAKTEYQELNVQYRYIFLDGAGVPLRNNPDWQFQKMASRTESFFSGNALDSNAADWRLEIRPAR
jgi:hypothetical protein